MQGKQITLDKLIEGCPEILIPIYQRNYKWTTKECKKLLEDIQRLIKNTDKTHYFGSITFVKDEKNRIHLIDGQQRIATIMLIMEAVVQLVDEKVLDCEDKTLCKFINDNYLYNKKDSKMKLKPFRDDSLAFESIFKKNTKKYSDTDVVMNFNFIKNYIEFIKAPADEIFYAIQRLEIATISIDEIKDDAQEIYESLNSTGVPMSASDKIRNYILMGASHEQQEHYYCDYWNKIETNAGIDDVDAFIVYYLIVSHFYSLNRASRQKDVYEDFKTYVRMKKNASYDIEEILSSMLEYSKAYRCIIDANIGKPKLDLSLKRINILKRNETCLLF